MPMCEPGETLLDPSQMFDYFFQIKFALVTNKALHVNDPIVEENQEAQFALRYNNRGLVF